MCLGHLKVKVCVLLSVDVEILVEMLLYIYKTSEFMKEKPPVLK